ncbi:MAG: hypothetical protein AAGG99_03170, partial [Pseudomonadota bacterium]
MLSVIFAVAAVVVATSVQSASAGQVCVTCDSPATIYECLLPTPDGAAARNRAIRSAEKLVCMREIAARYGHRTCRVRKNAQGPCTGAVVDLGAGTHGGTATATVPPTRTPPASNARAPASSGTTRTTGLSGDARDGAASAERKQRALTGANGARAIGPEGAR